MQNIWNDENLKNTLKQAGIAVMPTDTLYGIVGQAQNISTVNRIYDLKKRAPEKPCIILVSGIADLAKFSIFLSFEQEKALKDYWPGPVSIILDCPDDSLSYLHRDTNTLAFRMPDSQSLQDLLLETGPLIAPSANPEGFPVAEDIKKAKEYFGENVDVYADGGYLSGKASRLIKLHKDGSATILRA